MDREMLPQKSLFFLLGLFVRLTFVFSNTLDLMDESPSTTLLRNRFEITKTLYEAAISPHGGRLFEAGFGSCGIPDVPNDSECVEDLAAFPELAARSETRTVRRLACLAHTNMRPWMRIPGVQRGMGARGMISPRILHHMGHMGSVLSCCGHVRIVKGVIFFRFGGFEFEWYKMRRFVFSIIMIKEAIARYKLHSLNAEFFLNTCDTHISKAASVAKGRAGLPIFSTHGSTGSIDILYPDPVDLSESYFRRSEKDAVPWAQKQSRAVFRGQMTNFHLIYDQQWRPSPRMRLHRMSDVRPDLLDARIVKGGDNVFLDELREDGVEMGKRLGPSEMQVFKYEIELDGGTGSCRTCGLLSSNQVMIKHASEHFEYFYPLLCANRHFIPTHRYFTDLYEQIEWARDHDVEAQQIVKHANRLARDTCTWEGRRLYWAILLAKYSSSALEDPANITRPAVFNCTAPPEQSDVVVHGISSKKPVKWYPKCGSPEEDEGQSPCTHWCSGSLQESKWRWLTVDILDNIQVFKPQSPGIRFRDDL